MKKLLAYTFVLLFGCLTLMSGCKSNKEIKEPSQIEVHVLAELRTGVSKLKIQEDLSQFAISEIKATSKTLNQFIFKVTLENQSTEELLKAFKSIDYVKSAEIAPTGDTPAENMPSGKSTKSKPIRGN